MKTALVTGASGAIGGAIATALACDGYALALNYHSNRQKAEDLAKFISQKYSVPACAVYADISNPNDVRTMVDTVLSEFGHIDVLVNNSGIAQQKLFTDITDEDWHKMVSTNLSGAFYTTREVVKSMLKHHSGSIINISSMWGQVGASCEVHYSTAKAGIIGMTKALAKEVSLSNIRVNCVCPGAVKSDMLSGFTNEDLQAICDETPLSRLGEPQDIANMVSFLASDKASFITGQIIGVNGGMII